MPTIKRIVANAKAIMKIIFLFGEEGADSGSEDPADGSSSDERIVD
jgi:hypothetical protein